MQENSLTETFEFYEDKTAEQQEAEQSFYAQADSTIQDMVQFKESLPLWSVETVAESERSQEFWKEFTSKFTLDKTTRQMVNRCTNGRQCSGERNGYAIVYYDGVVYTFKK